jgi:hypothetical protein
MSNYFCLVLILFSFTAQATVLNTQYISAARSRKYIGGKDESDLKVQAVLYQAPNKRKKPVKTEPSERF